MIFFEGGAASHVAPLSLSSRLTIGLLFAIPACAGNQELIARASQAVQAGDFQAACILLRPAATDAAAPVDVWNLLGICESELKRNREAAEAFRNGLRLQPQSVPLLENLGLLYFRNQDYANARKQLDRAVSLGSTNPGVRFSLAAAKIRTGDERSGLQDLLQLEPTLSTQAAYWTERGWVELDQKTKSAAASFDRALQLAPGDPRALNGAATVAESQKDDEKALSLLLQARKSDPSDVAVLLHLGSVCLRRDLVVDAVDTLKRAYELAPANNLALFLYARAIITTQHWQQAHDLFVLFDDKVPNYAPAQFALGWLEMKLNLPAEARRHLERTLALDPLQLDARCELAQLDIEQDRLSDAHREVALVLAKRPESGKANLLLGDLLSKGNRWEDARQHYEKAIHADPGSGPAHYKLSTALMRLHQPAAAERERTLGARLNAESEKSSKVVLVLAEPDGGRLGIASQ